MRAAARISMRPPAALDDHKEPKCLPCSRCCCSCSTYLLILRREEILGTEKQMLAALQYDLTVPTCYLFSARFRKAAGVASDQKVGRGCRLCLHDATGSCRGCLILLHATVPSTSPGDSALPCPLTMPLLLPCAAAAAAAPPLLHELRSSRCVSTCQSCAWWTSARAATRSACCLLPCCTWPSPLWAALTPTHMRWPVTAGTSWRRCCQ